ncbi:hypothetical protein [Streptomyces sp. NBC_00623]|uniref:hypothetical protein n=1 Tax=Streptomyces sp. NBC_00623 TaxID=2975790 RepID=UPI0030E1B865
MIGTPYGSQNGVDRAGFVSVVYGSATGLGPSEPAVISQNSVNIPGAAEADDNFGSAFTSADLDADGYADMVVGTRTRTSGPFGTRVRRPSCGAAEQG